MILGTVDIILVVAYFALLIWVGYQSSRKQDEEDFLLAKRDLGMWRTMFTLNASKIGSVLMTFTALIFIWGFSAVWFLIGIILGMLLFLPFALRLYKLSGGKYYTLADYFKYNYGRRVAKLVSVIGIILIFGYLIINLIAATKIFVFFIGWPFWISSIIMASVILFYIALAGYRAVVKTDVIQYSAMMAILLIIAILLFNGSLIPSSELSIFGIDGVSIFGFLLVGLLSAFALPDIWQRVYSAKGPKELRNGWLVSITIYAIMMALLTMIALTVKARFPSIDPDLALIHGFANLLPAGLIGLSVVLLFAAIMSTIDTYLFTATSSLIQDFFPFDKKKTVSVMKKTSLGLAILGVLISVLVQDIVISSYIFVSLVIILAVPVIFTWINNNISEKALITSLIFGSVGFIGGWTYIFIIGEIKVIVAIYILGLSILGLIFGGVFNLLK